MNGRWESPNFDITKWDKYGSNELTTEVKNMSFGLVPHDNYAVFVLATDAEYCHMLLDNFRRRGLKNRIRNLFTRNKGEK